MSGNLVVVILLVSAVLYQDMGSHGSTAQMPMHGGYQPLNESSLVLRSFHKKSELRTCVTWDRECSASPRLRILGFQPRSLRLTTAESGSAIRINIEKPRIPKNPSHRGMKNLAYHSTLNLLSGR
eukprot:447582-Amphidinium_carterae.1